MTSTLRLNWNELLDEYRRLNPRSAEMSARASAVLPGGTTRTTTFFQPFPPTLVSGAGCMVLDVDGNQRVDFLNNYTSLILGHAHEKLTAAAYGAAESGSAFASPTEHEILLAEVLCNRVESLDKVRFTNSGTEATMAALRLARAFTGQSVVVRFAGSYHGTHDYTTTPGAGVPPEVDALVLTARFNDLDSVAEIFRTARQVIAAVIVEPVLGAGGVIPAEPRFLEGLRELTADHGALLIFDEVISFRLHRGGAQARYDVAPDLTTLGKIIGGGFPIGAFGGRDDVMALLDPDAGVISWGGTFNGNPVSAAAGVAALAELTEDVIEGLNASGETLVESVNDALRADGLPVHVTGVGSLFNIHTRSDPITDGSAAMIVDRELLAALHIGLMNRGFFLAPRGLGSISTPMTQLEIRGLADSIVDLSTALLAGT